MIAVLFASVAVLWGLSWFAIHLQVSGHVPPVVAVFWRFAVSTIVLMGGLVVTRRLRRAPPGVWPWIALMGACLFSVNFIAVYGSEAILPSGFVSVIFSMVTVFNALNQWIFFRIRPTPRTLIGALAAVAGVGLMAAGQGSLAGAGGSVGAGIVLALCGTLLFSLGNIISRRLAASALDLPNITVRGMAAGAALLGVVSLARGYSLMPPLTLPWLGGLAYLGIPGSVVAFLAYLELIRRLGADRAAYTTVISPVIALFVSSVMEGAQWHLLTLLGVGAILLGNIIVFARLPQRRAGVAARTTTPA